MTPEQADEIRLHIIKELNNNGFGDVVTEVNTRLEEEYEEGEFQRNSRFLLIFFLNESIEILENLSNRGYPRLIARLDECLQGEGNIESISVELLSANEQTYYDLENLPDYNEIISSFKIILNEIRQEY